MKDLVLKILEYRDERIGAGLPEAALRRDLHRATEILEFRDVRESVVARLYHLDALEELPIADAARRALAARLFGEELHEVLQHVDHLTMGTEHHNRSARGERLVGDLLVEPRTRNALARGAADLHGFRVLAADELQHVVDRRTPIEFVHARTLDVARDGEEFRARRFRRALRGILLAAHQQDVRNRRQRLDVVDRRRSAEKARVHGEGRTVARLAAMTLQRLD